MGQATLNLPDPVDETPKPLSNADDLLSQLAGEEIDRLLADADVSTGADSQDEAEEAAPAATPVFDRLPAPNAADVELSQSVNAAGAAGASAANAPSELPGTLQPDSGSQLVVPAAETETAETATPAAMPPAPAVTPASSPLPVETADLEQPTTAAERAALAPAEPVPSDAYPADVAGPVLDNSEPADGAPQRPSLLLRLLQVVNAPLDLCPDAVRDVLGKVAILTLLNSIGVLVYLVLFRR